MPLECTIVAMIKAIKYILVVGILLLLTILVYLNLNKSEQIQVKNPVVVEVEQTLTPTPAKILNMKTPQVDLNLKDIFEKPIETSAETIVIAATGDYIPARSVNYLSVRDNNYTWTVQKTASIFKNADVVLVNLETPLTENCPLTNEGFVFCGSLQHIKALKMINATVVNLANNHSHNYGEDGIKQTTDLLDKNGIKYSGIYGENAIIEVKGTKIAFLGYNEIGVNPYPVKPAEDDLIIKDIKQAKQIADIVVVSFSWGVEYTTNITDTQKHLAKIAIDSGADLIIGNHPHQIQPIQIYNNKLVTYAHGNYVFDQMWSEDTKKGIVGFYAFENSKLVNADFTPIYIQNYGESEIAPSQMGDEILRKFESVSYELEE